MHWWLPRLSSICLNPGWEIIGSFYGCFHACVVWSGLIRLRFISSHCIVCLGRSEHRNRTWMWTKTTTSRLFLRGGLGWVTFSILSAKFFFTLWPKWYLELESIQFCYLMLCRYPSIVNLFLFWFCHFSSQAFLTSEQSKCSYITFYWCYFGSLGLFSVGN